MFFLSLLVFFSLRLVQWSSAENWSQVHHAVDTDMVVRLPDFAQVRYVHRQGYKNSSRILFWTTAYSSYDAWFWWFAKKYRTETCPDLPCEFTIDHRQLNNSDAVVFMVYGSTMDMKADLRSQIPPHRQPHQRYVYFSIEPPRLNRSELNLTKLNGLFNWTMTYRRDSDVYAHFGKAFLSRLPDVERAADERRDYAAGKSKMAVWFVTHCGTAGHRELYVRKLQKRLQVDIYGGCGKLKCRPFGSEKCNKVIADYKFYLSFENVLCKDYVSEKLMEALATDAVPIVFGGADYSKYAPAGSYINALEFASPEALADYLHFLDTNPSEYNRFFDWKRGYSVMVLRHQLYACELCAKLLQDRPQEAVKTYDDIEQWWNGEGSCSRWEDEKADDRKRSRPYVREMQTP